MKMRKRKTAWLWGIADSEYAGNLATKALFPTRKAAREWDRYAGPGRYFECLDCNQVIIEMKGGSSEYAGNLATKALFPTRKAAREWARYAGPGRYYAVKIEASWDIQERDRW